MNNAASLQKTVQLVPNLASECTLYYDHLTWSVWMILVLPWLVMLWVGFRLTI